MTRRRMPKSVGIATLTVILAASTGVALNAALAGPPADQTPEATSSPVVSTAVVDAAAAAPAAAETPADATKQLIGPNDQWYYYYGAGYDRKQLGSAFRWDETDYKRGAQPIGFGSTYNKTELKAFDDSKPLTAFFKTAVLVPEDRAAWKTLRLTLRADDGAAVYVNGREVGRFNLPAGTLTDKTYATTAPRTSVARANPRTIDVPVGTLAEDTGQVIAVELHANYHATPDMSMQLTADLVPDPSRDVLSTGSTWSYRYTTTPVASNWKNDCQLGNESKGASPLGFGSSTMATNLDIQPYSTRPLTAYFCTWVSTPDAKAFGDLEITTWANDGIVLYVNGKEVKRANMPTGTITPGTYATVAPRLDVALRNPITVTIPSRDLSNGGNVIAAEVHLNWRGTPDMSFDLTAHATGTK